MPTIKIPYANTSNATHSGAGMIKSIKGDKATINIIGYGPLSFTITPEQKKLIKVGQIIPYEINIEDPL